MQERVKLFTFVNVHGGGGAEVAEEARINDWLSSVEGTLSHVAVSESHRGAEGHHVTIALWYIPQAAS